MNSKMRQAKREVSEAEIELIEAKQALHVATAEWEDWCERLVAENLTGRRTHRETRRIGKEKIVAADKLETARRKLVGARMRLLEQEWTPPDAAT